MKQLKNHMEEAVERHLQVMLPGLDFCQCEGCRLDVMALALNRLQPHYVVTDIGALYARVDEQMDYQHNTDVVAAITEAVTIVKKMPRH